MKDESKLGFVFCRKNKSSGQRERKDRPFKRYNYGTYGSVKVGNNERGKKNCKPVELVSV